MYNQLKKVHLSFIILLLPSVCSAGAPSMPFIEIVYVVYALLGVFYLGVAALIIKILVLFLKSLSKCLDNCDEHATMSSNLVWLNLIPFFNFAWMIYTVIKVSESIEKKFEASGAKDPSKGAKLIGLIYSISIVTVPFIGITIITLLGFICWFFYWLKIRAYNKSIPELQEPSSLLSAE